MLCYCIENDIIKLDNIKYVIKSPLSLKKDYCNKLIDYCYTNVKDYSGAKRPGPEPDYLFC